MKTSAGNKASDLANVRKSYFQPSLRRGSNEAAVRSEQDQNLDQSQHRAKTAPSKRRKWGQDGEIEILTHREGKHRGCCILETRTLGRQTIRATIK